MDRHSEALRELEPPTGGIRRFEERLDRLGDSRTRATGIPVAAALGVSLLGVIVIGIVRQPDVETAPSVYEAPAFDRLLGRTMEEAPLRISIDDEPVSASLVASADPNIRIYEIERD